MGLPSCPAGRRPICSEATAEAQERQRRFERTAAAWTAGGSPGGAPQRTSGADAAVGKDLSVGLATRGPNFACTAGRLRRPLVAPTFAGASFRVPQVPNRWEARGRCPRMHAAAVGGSGDGGAFCGKGVGYGVGAGKGGIPRVRGLLRAFELKQVKIWWRGCRGKAHHGVSLGALLGPLVHAVGQHRARGAIRSAQIWQ